jgi:Serine hydrolase (FSH1)
LISRLEIVSFRHVLQKQLAEDGSQDTFEFEFVDGLHASRPGAGVDLFYDPPYYSWWLPNPALEDMWKARDWLKQHIKQNGPYDGVIMFSQGCTLGASILLDHFKETPNDPPPFKFAIFICGGPSLVQLESEFGFTIAPELWDIDAASVKSLSKRADSSAILAQGSNRWQNDLSDVTDLSLEALMEMVRGPYRINIPTVHVIGANDPRNLAGHHLYEISHPDARRIYEHSGGHDIPRNQTTSLTLCRLLRWASSPLTTARLAQAK